MADIIRLKLAPRKPAAPHAGAGAEIILFPGVRYERHAEAVAVKPKRKRKSRAKQAAVSHG